MRTAGVIMTFEPGDCVANLMMAAGLVAVTGRVTATDLEPNLKPNE
jgi:hypothetical protein